MSLDLAAHLAVLEDEYRASLATPLALRQALLVAVLLDHFPDRLFAAYRDEPALVFGAEDLPAFRAALAQRVPALATVFALAGQKPDGPRLEIVAVEVPIADYPALSIQDFMVSLYNRHTVQRVAIVAPDGTQLIADAVFAAALAWCRASLLALA